MLNDIPLTIRPGERIPGIEMLSYRIIVRNLTPGEDLVEVLGGKYDGHRQSIRRRPGAEGAKHAST
jgi:hypothetical protein